MICKAGHDCPAFCFWHGCMNKEQKAVPLKKALLIILGVLAAVAIGIFIYLRSNGASNISDLLKKKLQQAVSDGSNGLYHLEMTDADIDIGEMKVVITHAELIPDSSVLKQMELAKTAPNDIYRIRLNSISVEGIDVAKAVASGKFSAGNIYIDKPQIEIFHSLRNEKTAVNDSLTVYQKIGKGIGFVQVDKLVVKEASLVYTNLAKGGKQSKLNSVGLDFTNILIDSTTQKDSTRFLFARDARITVVDYNLKTGNDWYNFSIDSVAIETVNHAVIIKGLALKPRYSREEFGKVTKKRQDRYDIRMNSIRLKNVDWWKLFSEEGLEAEEADIQGGKLYVYCNRSLPGDQSSKIGNYPSQALQKLKLPIHIPQVKVTNLDIAYEEYNPNSKQMGTIYFDNATGGVTNLSNMPEYFSKEPVMKMYANAAFMHKTNIDVVFSFSLLNVKGGVFGVKATLGKLDGRDLNEHAAKPLGLFEVVTGDIDHLKIDIKGNNNKASGNIDIVYSNLKINALKGSDSDSGELKKRGFLTFIANTFVINKDHPTKKESNSIHYAEYQRIPEKSFFNLVWKTILTGVTGAVGYKKPK